MIFEDPQYGICSNPHVRDLEYKEGSQMFSKSLNFINNNLSLGMKIMLLER